MRRPLVTMMLSFGLLSCIERPDFADYSIVAGPRVLAVVVEPPEIGPGQSAALSVLIAGVEDREGMRISWRACGTSDGLGFGGGSQFGEGAPDEGCGGGLSFPLGEGETATLPGLLTESLFDNLELIAMSLGGLLPEGIIDQIRSQVGLTFLIEATVIADGRRIRAVKRVLLSESETPHSNPPPPAYRFGDIDVAALEDDPGRCEALGGAPITALTGASVELAPYVPQGEDEEDWLETYKVLSAQGMVLGRRERAFYSWFSTAGELEQGTTKSPLRNEIWRLPRQPGTYPLWLVVRDGHGGTSACEAEVVVR